MKRSKRTKTAIPNTRPERTPAPDVGQSRGWIDYNGQPLLDEMDDATLAERDARQTRQRAVKHYTAKGFASLQTGLG